MWTAWPAWGARATKVSIQKISPTGDIVLPRLAHGTGPGVSTRRRWTGAASEYSIVFLLLEGIPIPACLIIATAEAPSFSSLRATVALPAMAKAKEA